jgi:hypothetical protein
MSKPYVDKIKSSNQRSPDTTSWPSMNRYPKEYTARGRELIVTDDEDILIAGLY